MRYALKDTLRRVHIETGYGAHAECFGFDHINRNAPVLIRTPKLTQFEPA